MHVAAMQKIEATIGEDYGSTRPAGGGCQASELFKGFQLAGHSVQLA